MKKITLFLTLSGCSTVTKAEFLGYTIEQHIVSFMVWGLLLWGGKKILEKLLD